MSCMHFIIDILYLLDELFAIIRVINHHVILLSSLLLLESLQEAVSAILVNVPMSREIIDYSFYDLLVCRWTCLLRRSTVSFVIPPIAMIQLLKSLSRCKIRCY